MKNNLNSRKIEYIEQLRSLPIFGEINISIKPNDIENATQYLQQLYPDCRVQRSFAERIFIKNEIYGLPRTDKLCRENSSSEHAL